MEQITNKGKILLMGEGVHQHTAYLDEGTATISGNDILVEGKVLVKHEKPDKSFGEHFTLPMEAGDWITGEQMTVEFGTNFLRRVLD